MRRWIKRLVVAIALLLALLLAGGWWFISYIAPQQKLDLTYEPINISAKALDMVKRLKPELIITEEDVDNLVKMQLQDGAANQTLPPNVKLDGAQIELNGDQLLAHLNVTYLNTIPAELLVTYQLSWQAPNIVVEPVSVNLKGIALSTDNLERITIPLEMSIQNLVTVSDVRFEGDHIVVKLQMQL